MDIPYLICQFVSWWTFELSPLFAVMNNTAKNIRTIFTYKFLGERFLLSTYIEVEFLSYMITPCLVF